MNQIVRGGDDPTPPEGGTTRMPQTSGLRGQILGGLIDRFFLFKIDIC